MSAYAKKNGYLHSEFFVDDSISGTTFDRPDFKSVREMARSEQTVRNGKKRIDEIDQII